MKRKKKNRIMTDSELVQIGARFRLLGEPMRLKILQAVCDKPRTVTEIVSATGATQANVSKHLALLAAGDILAREKDGQRVFYSIKDKLVVKLCALVHSQLD
jgi:DNA-binding transcriptional ArsR family regulator